MAVSNHKFRAGEKVTMQLMRRQKVSVAIVIIYENIEKIHVIVAEKTQVVM